MTTVTQQRLRPRPARKIIWPSWWSIIANSNLLDTAGPTHLAYTPDGTRLITAGSNNVVRVYKTGSDGEPTNIDDCSDSNMAVVASASLQLLDDEPGLMRRAAE
jgi:hypothetical protein